MASAMPPSLVSGAVGCTCCSEMGMCPPFPRHLRHRRACTFVPIASHEEMHRQPVVCLFGLPAGAGAREHPDRRNVQRHAVARRHHHGLDAAGGAPLLLMLVLFAASAAGGAGRGRPDEHVPMYSKPRIGPPGAPPTPLPRR